MVPPAAREALQARRPARGNPSPMRRSNLVSVVLILALLVPCYVVLVRFAMHPDEVMSSRAEVAPDPHRPEGHDLRPIVSYPPRGAEFIGLLALVGWLHVVLLLVLGERPETPLWRRVAVHLVVLAAALLALEGGMRAYMARVGAPFRPDALLMYRPRPMPGNPFGLRSEMPKEGSERILVLGDSATWGAYVNENEAWPALLGKLTGKDVINAGIPGYSSSQGRFMGPELIAFYHPMIVIYGYNNDCYPAEREDARRVPASAFERQVLRALYGSEAYLLIRRVLVNASIRVTGEPSKREENTWRVSRSQHVENMTAIAAAAKAEGARVVMLTMPTPHATGYDEATQKAASQAGALMIDLNPIWEGKSVLRRQLIPDVVHPTPEGHRRIAALIAKALK